MPAGRHRCLAEHAEVRHRAGPLEGQGGRDRQSGPQLAKLANEFAEKVAKVYIHEAFSAGSLDASSVVVPAAMDRVALGRYEAEQFEGHFMDCLRAQMVVFSGLKIDKLDDLEAMINRGKIRTVFTAGSLAMASRRPPPNSTAGSSIGVSEDPGAQGQAVLHPARSGRAGQDDCRGPSKGIEFVMPVDFVLQDGRVPNHRARQPAARRGARARAHFIAKKVDEFIAAHKGQRPPAVAFHNGVFGMFEDPRFEAGTRSSSAELKRMTDAGIRVYVGGGEGGTALEKYGQARLGHLLLHRRRHGAKRPGQRAGALLVALKLAAETMGPPPHGPK